MSMQEEPQKCNVIATDPPSVEPEETLSTKPLILIRVIRENLEAELQFQRTGTDTADPLIEDVMTELAEHKIVYGINTQKIEEICTRPFYDHWFVIARGQSPKVGEDGWVEYLVPTSREMRPKPREDGTVDFKDLGFIQIAHKDQPLCKIHPPEKGPDGRDVYGTLLEGSCGKEANNPAGTNTVFDETGTILRAACDGSINVKQWVIHILDILRIQGDVDNATGNIDFTGDVYINGDVLSGFCIVTRGNIIVKGSVGGAILRADGNISIADSMNGDDRGSLRAGGDIRCRFIQNCEVYAEGNIYADTIMHCSTACNGDIELSGKRAALIGGKSSIAGRIFAKTIGTSTHVSTEVNICAAGLNEDREAATLAQNIGYLDSEITKLIQILTRYESLRKKTPLTQDQLDTIVKVKESYIQLSNQRKSAQAQLELVKKGQLVAANNVTSYIECKDRVHTGTRLVFGPVVMQVNKSFENSRVYLEDGAIAIVPIV